MNARITLSIDESVLSDAKKFAEKNNISFSGLIELLLRQITAPGHYKPLEDYPIADWVNQVAEGEAEYKTPKRSRKQIKDEYHNRKK